MLTLDPLATASGFGTFCVLSDASVISLTDGSQTRPESFRQQRMEAYSTIAHASASATLADRNALQLGAPGRNHAFVSRSGKEKRSALSGSVGRGRGDSGTAWLPAAPARH